MSQLLTLSLAPRPRLTWMALLPIGHLPGAGSSPVRLRVTGAPDARRLQPGLTAMSSPQAARLSNVQPGPSLSKD